MATVISTHSFRGGTGKSNITANMAVRLAQLGKRVGVFDGDIQSPGIHILFNMNEQNTNQTMNDYLWGNCAIEDASYEVYRNAETNGLVYLVPASIRSNDIARILREGYDANDVHAAYRELIAARQLDYLLIDTHPGLNEETLLSITVSQILLIVLRPDQQDFQGTSVTVEIARRLRVPHIYLIVNKIPDVFDMNDVKTKVERTYQCDVLGLIGLSTDIAQNASARPYVLDDPNHPFSRTISEMVDQVYS